MSPVIAAMVVSCAICAVLIVLIVISGVYFWLDYREFRNSVHETLKGVPEYKKYQEMRKFR